MATVYEFVFVIIMAFATAEGQNISGPCFKIPPPCSHFCVPTDGGKVGADFLCSCAPGYSIMNDQKRCKANAWAADKPSALVVFLDEEGIKIVPIADKKVANAWGLEPGTPKVLVDDVTSDSHFALNMKGELIYYTARENSEIRYTYINGTNGNLLMNGFGSISAIAYDWIGGNIYAFDSAASRNLLACSVSTKSCVPIGRELVDDVRGFVSIVVDSAQGKMYLGWCDSDNGGGGIRSASMDGKRVENILDKSECVTNMAMNPALKVIYWYAEGSNIEVLNTKNKIRLSIKVDQAVQGLSAVAPYENDLIWTAEDPEFNSYSILVADKFHLTSSLDDDHIATIAKYLTSKPRLIQIMHPVLQIQPDKNVCDGLRCGSACILSGDKQAECVCQSHQLLVSGQCIANTSDPLILVLKNNRLHHFSINHIGGPASLSIWPDTTVTSLSSDVTLKTTLMATQDGENANIEEITLEGSQFQRKVKLTVPKSTITDMAIDHVESNVYWINNKTKKIFFGSLKTGKVQQPFASGTKDPNAVAIDSAKRKMYIAGCSEGGNKIEACGLEEGQTQCAEVVSKVKDCVNDIVVSDNRVYFSNPFAIQYVYKDDPNVVTSFRTTGGSEFLALSGSSRLLWTDSENGEVMLESASAVDEFKDVRVRLFEDEAAEGLSHLGLLYVAKQLQDLKSVSKTKTEKSSDQLAAVMMRSVAAARSWSAAFYLSLAVAAIYEVTI